MVGDVRKPAGLRPLTLHGDFTFKTQQTKRQDPGTHKLETVVRP